MRSSAKARREAAKLDEGDVIAVLLRQHARVRDLFDDVASADGGHKQRAFDELRALLAVHETAEEMVLRPISERLAGRAVVDARNAEEARANEVLAALEDLDVASPDFDEQLEQFRQAVVAHAEAEESEEFPAVLEGCDDTERLQLGRALQAAEAVAPTHPHPSTAGSTVKQWAVGPAASLVDRTRDAIRSALG
ncbi:hemerythrin domain-containing protein [Intrasporangium sp. YIM S08009]|uniref:hemerythrin domain-containing protein n=1 Tax=Intrasporangium zincisolvens TaxID=3080018 RepID=UPI002B0624B2|nr:hemerythrin domain-containing protein [Intrasporangium sp. YIM S08009]